MDFQTRHRELAFKAWCQTGRNLVKTVKVLSRDHGYDITRQSLAKWRDDYEWERRAAALEIEEQERLDAMSDTSILNSLLARRRQYEEYFDTLGPGQIDNQAQYGLNSVLKTLIDIRKESGHFKVEEFGAFFRDLVAFLRKEDPEAATAVARNFDSFTAYIRKKYVS